MKYTYLIGWSNLDTYYYGVRYSKHASPDELWIHYKTSSKYVDIFYKEHGDPDIIQIRKMFDDSDKAMKWESTVLRRMHMVDDTRFLNRWDNNMVPLKLDGPFPFQSNEIQQKIDNSLREKYNGRGSGSEEIKDKVYETCLKKYGTHHTLHTENVTTARENGSIEKYGTTNPFYSKEFQASLTPPMHDPVIRAKVTATLRNKDWSERNENMKRLSMEKYGVSCSMNTPEQIEKRKHDTYSCPFGCKNNHEYVKGNFVQHMTKYHQWNKEKIYDFCTKNKKNPN